MLRQTNRSAEVARKGDGVETIKLEQRSGDTWVVVYSKGGVRPASRVEVAMWLTLVEPALNRDAAREGQIRIDGLGGQPHQAT